MPGYRGSAPHDEKHDVRWETGPSLLGSTADFETDANLVVYAVTGWPLWMSNTCCHSYQGWQLAVRADGNVVIYDGNDHAAWATNTSR